jgi:hypothetical protein
MNKCEVKQAFLNKLVNNLGSEEYLDKYLDWVFSHEDSTELVVERHHILPRYPFKEYSVFKKNPWNKRVFTPKDHVWAHYFLFRAFPGVRSVVQSFCFMFAEYENRWQASKDLMISESGVEKISEAYQKAKETNLTVLAKFWSPRQRAQQAEIQRRVNQYDNRIERNYTCGNCNREFKQIRKSVFAGHRKACLATKPAINPYHEILQNQEWIISSHIGAYYKYIHSVDSRVIEVTYNSTNDKTWFCGSVSGTTKSSLLTFLFTGFLTKHKPTPAEEAVDRSKMRFNCSGCQEIIVGLGEFNRHRGTCQKNRLRG